MSYNHGLERKKFEARQRRLRQQYEKAGMTEVEIQALYQLDLQEFLDERRHREHTRPFTEERAAETKPEEGFSRYAWIEEISNPVLTMAIKSLTQADLMLLTLYVIDGYSQTEIAASLSISQQNVSRRITHLKKYFKKF